jgi:hypothetical protein
MPREDACGYLPVKTTVGMILFHKKMFLVRHRSLADLTAPHSMVQLTEDYFGDHYQFCRKTV